MGHDMGHDMGHGMGHDLGYHDCSLPQYNRDQWSDFPFVSVDLSSTRTLR